MIYRRWGLVASIWGRKTLSFLLSKPCVDRHWPCQCLDQLPVIGTLELSKRSSSTPTSLAADAIDLVQDISEKTERVWELLAGP